MRSASLTDADVRVRGWEALVEKLGPSGALRFSMLTERGYGDYAKARHRALGSLSVDERVGRMKQSRVRPPRARR